MSKELEEALYTAKERCEGNIIIDEASMNGFEEIYPFTTENIAGYIDYFDLQDQIINAALKGAKDVTLLDINPYAKYYYYLKAAGILELDLVKFNEFFLYQANLAIFRHSGRKVKTFNENLYEEFKVKVITMK